MQVAVVIVVVAGAAAYLARELWRTWGPPAASGGCGCDGCPAAGARRGAGRSARR